MPRTESEVLKDFEKLGYEVNKARNNFLCLELIKNEEKNKTIIYIDKPAKVYYKRDYFWDFITITMQEHKLLNELFTIWGWLDE